VFTFVESLFAEPVVAFFETELLSRENSGGNVEQLKTEGS